MNPSRRIQAATNPPVVFFQNCTSEYHRFCNSLPEDAAGKEDLFYTYLGEWAIKHAGDPTQPNNPKAHDPLPILRPTVNWPVYFSLTVKAYQRLQRIREDNAEFIIRVWYLRHMHNAKNQPADN